MSATSNSLICIDASIVVRLVTDRPGGPISTLWNDWDIAAETLVAPALLRYEMTNALYRYGRLGQLDAASVDLALQTALSLPVELHDESGLHPEAIHIARRFNLPAAYDAHYLALAERLGVGFWTVDRRLARAVESDLRWVHLAG